MKKQDILNQIIEIQKDSIKTYNDAMEELYGELLSWTFIENLSTKDLITFQRVLLDKKKIEDSIIDIDKLTHQILVSQSEFGTIAKTAYICEICGQTDTWNTTNTPLMCNKCAHNISSFITKRWGLILKDDKLNLILELNKKNNEKLDKSNLKENNNESISNNKLKFMDKIKYYTYKLFN